MKPGKHLTPLAFEKFQPNENCVVLCIEEYLWWTKSINEKLENHPKQLLLSYAQPNNPIRYTIIVTICATPQLSWLHNSCYHMHHPTTQLVTQLLLPYVPPHNPVGYTFVVTICATPQLSWLHNCCYHMCHPTTQLVTQLSLSYAPPHNPVGYTIVVICATPQTSWLHNCCYHMHHPTTQLITQLLSYAPPRNSVGYTIVVYTPSHNSAGSANIAWFVKLFLSLAGKDMIVHTAAHSILEEVHLPVKWKI